jgi:acetyltransferase-like isoleucine patch superfamily enzyme
VTETSHLAHDWFPRPLPRNVALGDGSWLYSAFAFLHSRSLQPVAVRIGRSSGIYHGSFFDLGPQGTLVVGDFSTLVGVIIATNGNVSIGNYCFLAHEVVIADAFAARPWMSTADAATRLAGAGEPCVSLGDDVWVGAGATLLRGAHIGNGAVIGAAAVVDFTVPAYAVVAGNPGRIVGSVRDRGGPSGG